MERFISPESFNEDLDEEKNSIAYASNPENYPFHPTFAYDDRHGKQVLIHADIKKYNINLSTEQFLNPTIQSASYPPQTMKILGMSNLGNDASSIAPSEQDKPTQLCILQSNLADQKTGNDRSKPCNTCSTLYSKCEQQER